jgi:hypothetical protein
MQQLPDKQQHRSQNSSAVRKATRADDFILTVFRWESYSNIGDGV